MVLMTLGAAAPAPAPTRGLAPKATAAVSFYREVRPILEAKCISCHNPDKLKGDLDLTAHATMMKGNAEGATVIAGKPDDSPLVKSIVGNEPDMPLSGDPLGQEAITIITRWVAEGATDDTPADAPELQAMKEQRPPVTVRRLNRVEYNNTVHDLLGTDLRPADEFPLDGVSLGFDRSNDALSTSLLHIEDYERAAEELVVELFARPRDDVRQQRILTCATPGNGRGCATEILRRFVERAWRRPASDAELGPFQKLVDTSTARRSDRNRGLQLALQAVLMSPPFLFHLEGYSAEPQPHLEMFRIASRLSYFLWSSMPDDVLLADARAGRLQTAAQLQTHLGRMLDDPRAKAFVTDYASQWLMIQKLDTHSVDRKRFQTWRRAMKDSMRNETLAFFADFLVSNRPVKELLTARFTFVDQHLASHYGLELPEPLANTTGGDTPGSLPGAGPSGMVRVALDGLPRSGLLTQSSILTVASHPNRTSPTARGLWVMDRLLCEAPPPPPPDAGELPEAASEQNASIKDFLAAHRQSSRCSVCHDVMDTIGLGFENYDAIGQFRTTIDGKKIEVSGKLPAHGSFANAVELAEVLARDPRFERCLTQNLLTYAMGRSFEGRDNQITIQSLVDTARASGGGLRDYLSAIVLSEGFRGAGGASP